MAQLGNIMAMSEKKLKESFYTLQEVAKMLKVSDRSIFRYIHSGKLRAVKIGYWRISSDELGAFLLRSSNILKYASTKFPKPKHHPKKAKNKK
jgi:excisionase family DNA binding protein